MMMRDKNGYDSAVVANYFLELADEADKTLTPMQVLKLVYIAHGWMLGLYGVPLIRDRIEAWQYGPVIPDLYEKVRHFRGKPVHGPLPTDDPKGLEGRYSNLVRQVFGIYGNKPGMTLSGITHAKGTPWHKTYTPGSFGIKISDDFIEDHYHRLAEKARKSRKTS